jgi:hypothetical protein
MALELNQILSGFDGISIGELMPDLLMNRYDSKFLTHKDNLEEILNSLKPDYDVLTIDKRLISKYASLYFDTEDLDLYHDHHNERKNRYKFRYRCYEDSGDLFFEIKFKDNKNFTRKLRIPCDEIKQNLDATIGAFIKENSPYDMAKLDEVLEVNYDRITLVRKNQKDRITLDTNLSFNRGDEIIKFENLVIIEVKSGSPKLDKDLIQRFYGQHFKRRRVSKYCVGVINLIDGVKFNLYKEKLSQIKKIEQAC